VPVDGGGRSTSRSSSSRRRCAPIAGELGYGTGEGVRAEASWQHRNFFNPEGALTVRGWPARRSSSPRCRSGATISCAATRCSTLQALGQPHDRDAYRGEDRVAVGGIERQSNFIWQKKWTWSLGAELIATDERDTFEATGEEAAADLLHRRAPGQPRL
jgi:translocation and assembly module TamA